MSDCVFCKIVSGEIPSFKVYEDEEFLAFLDINPNTCGMTVLITKKHYHSYVFDLPDDIYTRFMNTARKVAKLLDETLGVQRTAMVMEGMGVDHAHLKFYPLHGLDEKFQEMWAKDRVYFENYPGYVTTKLGPRADSNKLEKLAGKIAMYKR